MDRLFRKARTGRRGGARAQHPFHSGRSGLSSQDVEAHYVEVVRAVKRTVKIPVALKLSPYFSSIGHMAHDLADAGADGLVLFNRFYQPDVDLATMSVKSDLHLSTSHETGLAAALDCAACGASQLLARGDEWCRNGRTSHQVSAGRRGHGDDDLGALAPWSLLHSIAGHRPCRMARGDTAIHRSRPSAA